MWNASLEEEATLFRKFFSETILDAVSSGNAPRCRRQLLLLFAEHCDPCLCSLVKRRALSAGAWTRAVLGRAGAAVPCCVRDAVPATHARQRSRVHDRGAPVTGR